MPRHRSGRLRLVVDAKAEPSPPNALPAACARTPSRCRHPVVHLLPVGATAAWLKEGYGFSTVDCIRLGLVLERPTDSRALPAGLLDNHVEARVVLLVLHARLGPSIQTAIASLRGSGWPGPILAIVALAALSRVGELMNGGLVDFVVHPVSLEEIAIRARRLAFAGRRRSTVSGLAGTLVTIDWISRRLTCENRNVTLSARQLQLFDALASTPGVTMSAGELAARAWGHDRATAARARTCISALRKKLAPFGRRFGIRTVRTVGYRFDTM